MIHLLKKYKTIIILSCTFLVGIGVGVIALRIYTISKEQTHKFTSILHDPTRGAFTNPILDCEFFQNDDFTSFKNLEYKLRDIIKDEQKQEHATDISVYFRDMNTGAWVGINEKEPFSPASLLKVPIMLAYYKYAEKDPALLTKQVEFHRENYESVELTQNIIPTASLIENKMYSIENLLYRMIVTSDNNSQFLLLDQMPASAFETVYVDLGIALPGIQNSDDFMTVKEYASFFRILYNATYLTRESSEKALELLSQVEYDKALKAGVPENIVVSHKFGERGYLDEDMKDIKQLHDCGIVYYPERPYLLCVMTRGSNLDILSQTIKRISMTVYQEINNLPSE